jgi:hypothetical protein
MPILHIQFSLKVEHFRQETINGSAFLRCEKIISPVRAIKIKRPTYIN